MADRSTARSPADFSIRVATRHPAARGGYDAERHRYRPDYVRPSGWTMELTAAVPGLAEPPRRPLGKRLDDPDDVGDPPVLPANIRSYTWTVKEAGGSFSETVTRQRDMSEPWRVRITVPRPGLYQVGCSVQTMTGRVERARAFRIRDSLMVSIGESFASGQGNPDVRAVPSDSQKQMCRFTTLSQFREALADRFDEFQEALADKGGFLGKAVALYLQGHEELLGAIEDLAGAVVDRVLEFGRLVFGGSSGPSPRPARWQEPYAYRSYQSGPARAAYLLESESDEHADRVTFLSFARSGAEIEAGLLGPRTVDGEPIDGWIGNIGEIQEVAQTVGDRRIDVLHISIGGNDIGFATTLTDIVLGDLPWAAVFTPWALVFQAGNDTGARREAVAEANKRLDRLRGEWFPALASAVAGLRPGQVFINEYPIGLFERMDAAAGVVDGGGCGIFSGPDLDLSLDDWLAIKQIGVDLNRLIHDVARRNGWTVVDGIAERFAGHGYCATADPERPGDSRNRRGTYFVSAEQSCRDQSDFEGVMHPNEYGHEVYAERIVAAVTGARRDRWAVPVLNMMASAP